MHEATVCRIVTRVETALIRAAVFKLPGKKQLQDPDFAAKVIIIVATETPIERPQKHQKQSYSGKKKRHTLKSQLVIDPVTKAVICTTFATGIVHDFRLFKQTQVKPKKETECHE